MCSAHTLLSNIWIPQSKRAWRRFFNLGHVHVIIITNADIVLPRTHVRRLSVSLIILLTLKARLYSWYYKYITWVKKNKTMFTFPLSWSLRMLIRWIEVNSISTCLYMCWQVSIKCKACGIYLMDVAVLNSMLNKSNDIIRSTPADKNI